MTVADVLQDLIAEQAALDAIVADLTDDQWDLPTPSPRWTVTDQIGHLTYFDRTATMAIEDPAAFAANRDELAAAITGELDIDELTLGSFRGLSPDRRLDEWRARRAGLATAAGTLANDSRVEWYGPSMGAKSFLTARLMECWAHGQDVCDAVGALREPTGRLRHIAQLGVITRGWSYAVRGASPPAGDIRVELDAPSGETWSWGPDFADNRVTGPAEDFCLVVTQRRHVDDTGLRVEGDAARDWMLVAQAFAGGPTTGPPPKGAR